jgi:transposase InsO family protein
LPLCAPAHHSASDAIILASLPPAPRHQPIAGGRRQQAFEEKIKAYPIGYFHIDIAELQTAEGKLYLYVAIDRTSKFAFVQLVRKTGRTSASAFLEALIAAVPYKIHTVLTDNGIQFTFPPRYAGGPTARYVTHMFDMRCQENHIEHRLTKIKHSWTNGQVERMNRTIKEATVQRSLRSTRSTRNSPCQLHQRPQLRSAAEDPEGPHGLRIHLQMLDFPARTIQT